MHVHVTNVNNMYMRIEKFDKCFMTTVNYENE